MSKLGKILLGVALAGALVALVAGFLLIQSYNTTKTSFAEADQKKTAAEADAKKQRDEAKKLAQEKAEMESTLTSSKTQVDDLTKKLGDAQKTADEASSALKKAQDDAAKATADLDNFNKTLNGQTVEGLIAAKAAAEKAAADAKNEQNILKDSYDKSMMKIADLTKAINDVKAGSAIPPGVSGKVTFVNRTWNFVVLDIGLSSNVIPGGELLVFHKNNLLGKVRITSVEENTAVADILPNVKGDIQIGDNVLN